MTPLAPKKIQKNGKEQWLADLRRFGAGRKFFDSESDAPSAIARFAKDQKDFGMLAIQMPHETRLRYLAFENRIAATGATLEQVVAHWERTRANIAARKMLSEAIGECIEAKKAAGRRALSLRQMRSVF